MAFIRLNILTTESYYELPSMLWFIIKLNNNKFSMIRNYYNYYNYYNHCNDYKFKYYYKYFQYLSIYLNI